jgi:23S rRNA-/tRNA-specific pseudouridylate synthase
VKSWVVRPTDPKTVGEIVRLAKEDVSAIEEGRVFIGKKRARTARDPVKQGDEIRIGKRDASADVPILFQREDLVAVAKPAGIPSVPDHHGSSHSLVAVVARMLKRKPADLRVTSRLDREVSGVVVFALSHAAEARLKDARARGEYARRYVAVASGEPSASFGTWDSAITGKDSATRYRVVARASRAPAAMLAVDPITGRTHQIRIHASRASLPLLGDPEYGGPRQITLNNGRIIALSRIALHAARVVVAGTVAEAPIPEELARVWTELGGEPEAWNTAALCEPSEGLLASPRRSSSS